MADIPNAIGAPCVSEYLSTHDAPELDELRCHREPACNVPLQFLFQGMKKTSAQLQHLTRCRPKRGSRWPQT